MKKRHELTAVQQAAVARFVTLQLERVGEPVTDYHPPTGSYRAGVEQALSYGVLRRSRVGKLWVSWTGERWYKCRDSADLPPAQRHAMDNPFHIITDAAGFPLGTDRQGPLCLFEKLEFDGSPMLMQVNTGWAPTCDVRWEDE